MKEIIVVIVGPWLSLVRVSCYKKNKPGQAMVVHGFNLST